MIKRLHIDNYRCLVNLDVRFGELALLVGPNGAGKSSILDLLYAVRQLLLGLAHVNDPSIFPARTLTRWQDGTTQVVEIDVDLPDHPSFNYRMEIEHDPVKRLARISLERLMAAQEPLFVSKMGEVQLYRDNHSLGPKYTADWTESALARVAPIPQNRKLTAFLEFMRNITICALNPKVFATDSHAEERVLTTDGANFSSWYRYQLQERTEQAHLLAQELRKVIDGFRSIQMERIGSETRSFLVVCQNQGRDYKLRLDELSDGQRALIALYSLLHLSTETDALLIDEPDNYVALAEIQPWLIALRDAAGAKPRQAVLCSHHPEAIDYLGVDAGLFLGRERTGAIAARTFEDLLRSRNESQLKLSEILARGWV